MGTRSVTHIQEDGITLASIYQHYDGDPSGVGVSLLNFLSQFKIVNGIRMEGDTKRIANGPGCLAAQLVSHLKTDVGGVYLTTPDHTESYDYTFNYIEYEQEPEIRVNGRLIGNFKDFKRYIDG